MTKAGKSLIVLLVDESGSMASVRDATVEAIKAFVVEQRKLPGEADLVFATFDLGVEREEVVDSFLRIHAKGPLASFDEDAATAAYHPRGGTPLYDAMGTLISRTGQDLAAMLEAERPERVIFVTQTDGQENASHRFTGTQVRSMVEHQQSKYGWEFIFLGAGINAESAGKQVGVLRGASYGHSGAGARAMSTYLADTVAGARYGSLPDPGFGEYVVLEDGSIAPAPDKPSAA
jgi:hypothetical protein